MFIQYFTNERERHLIPFKGHLQMIFMVTFLVGLKINMKIVSHRTSDHNNTALSKTYSCKCSSSCDAWREWWKIAPRGTSFVTSCSSPNSSDGLCWCSNMCSDQICSVQSVYKCFSHGVQSGWWSSSCVQKPGHKKGP